MEAPYQPEMRVRPVLLPIDQSRTLFADLSPRLPTLPSTLQHPEDTRHFDSDIPDEPLAPAGGAQPNATKDPILRHREHGRGAMDVRKRQAFAGFTYKSPRVVSHPKTASAVFEEEAASVTSDVAVEDEDEDGVEGVLGELVDVFAAEASGGAGYCEGSVGSLAFVWGLFLQFHNFFAFWAGTVANTAVSIDDICCHMIDIYFRDDAALLFVGVVLYGVLYSY